MAPGTPRPDPTHGVVSYLTAGASSGYDSLRANFRTAMGRRLSLRGAYRSPKRTRRQTPASSPWMNATGASIAS